MKKEFNDKLLYLQECVNEYLDEHLELPDVCESEIYKSMRYSALAGGKRIRPVILLAVCEMVGCDINKAMPFAAAIELIHNYSLVHDDLPAMDNDDYRRGKLTNHKMFGEAIAILSGDALLTKAFEIILIEAPKLGVPYAAITDAMAVLAKCSGTHGMIGGQVLDLLSENRVIDITMLENIHKKKTGELIIAAAKMGGIIGGASEKQIEKLCEYATNLGVAFQIRDDVLDVMGDEKITGKNNGSDEKCRKSTYVTICGLENSKKFISDYTQNAIKSLEEFGEKKEFLISLANSLVNRVK